MKNLFKGGKYSKWTSISKNKGKIKHRIIIFAVVTSRERQAIQSKKRRIQYRHSGLEFKWEKQVWINHQQHQKRILDMAYVKKT